MTLINLRSVTNKAGVVYNAGSLDTFFAEDYLPLKHTLQEAGSDFYMFGGSIVNNLTVLGSIFGYGATLTNVLPQGVLPIGSIPTLTVYIPQGQLISGSLPTNPIISGSLTGTSIKLTGSLIGSTVTYGTEYDNGNSGSEPIINWNLGQKQKITINGSPTITFSFTNPPGTGNFLLRCTQDTTGSTRSYAYPSNCLWAGKVAPTMSIGAGSIDILSFYYDGNGSYYGNTSLNYG